MVTIFMMSRLCNDKEVKNASWIIGGRLAQMVLSFFVSILTARYLGPSNYGIIGYASAYVSFFTALCTLGINSVIIKDFIDHPDEQGKAIGTSILLRVGSSILSACMMIAVVSILDKGEPTTIAVSALCGIALIFQVADTINYWFQSKYQSRIVSIVTFFAYFVVSVYKIVLLFLGKDVRWFAFASSVDYIVISILLIIIYKKCGGQKLEFSLIKAKSLLSKSYHYILSAMMIAVYGQIDKLMLKQMLNGSEVGYYSIATTVCSMWVFILQAIIDSIYPTILNLYNKDKIEFERKNKQLYAIIFYAACIVSIFFVVFGDVLISALYGGAYIPATEPLKIVTWYTAFAYLGVARNAWIVCENKQKYLKYMYAGAVIINIFLNIVFIPKYGASGSAMASLITQIFTSIIFPSLFKDMRPNAKLMIDAIFLRNVFTTKKKHS